MEGAWLRTPGEGRGEGEGGGRKGERGVSKSGAWGGGGSEGKEGKDEGFGLKYQACIC
jgi:hypothetical protein